VNFFDTHQETLGFNRILSFSSGSASSHLTLFTHIASLLAQANLACLLNFSLVSRIPWRVKGERAMAAVAQGVPRSGIENP
jgi:hypothetical protein